MCINLIDCLRCETSFLLSKTGLTAPSFLSSFSPLRFPLVRKKKSSYNHRGEDSFVQLFQVYKDPILRRTQKKKKMMQNAFASYEEMRASVPRCSVVQDFSHGRDRDTVVCPKPRRVGGFNPAIADPIRSLRWHVSHQQEVCDAKAGAELLDIILAKGNYGAEQSCTQAASSPPFFCGSPPSRVSNPLIQDARFGDEKVTPVSPRAIPIPSGLASSPSSSARKGGGCVRANFGNNPAVRIEGFDCLDRDRRNCSIPALA